MDFNTAISVFQIIAGGLVAFLVISWTIVTSVMNDKRSISKRDEKQARINKQISEAIKKADLLTRKPASPKPPLPKSAKVRRDEAMDESHYLGGSMATQLASAMAIGRESSEHANHHTDCGERDADDSCRSSGRDGRDSSD